MAIAIPMLLGYHPEESLVVSCLRGAAVDLTMRFDLAALPSPDEFADELAERIGAAKADLTIVAVFTDARPTHGLLPRTGLIEDLYGDERLRIVEAVLVSRRRWWSYLCADPVCCPPNGRPLDDSSEVATSLSAAFALNGSGVLADREALVNAIAFDGALDASGVEIDDAARAAVAELDADRVRVGEDRTAVGLQRFGESSDARVALGADRTAV